MEETNVVDSPGIEHDEPSADFVTVVQNNLWICSPEFAGHLTKRSSSWLMNRPLVFKNLAWHRKWVSLHGTELVYMDHEPTVENIARMRMHRSQITSSVTVFADDKEFGNPLGFSVHFNSEHQPDWHFRAESLEEKQNWLIKLSQVQAITAWIADYERIKILGVGGQGIVYELRHKQSGKRVAMKEMEIKSERQMTAAISEARFLKNIVESVNHPNLMRIEKVFQVGSHFSLVFPLCTGGELYESIASRGHFSEHDAACIMQQIISALDALHEHDLLHLDIKPENILFVNSDPDSKIVVTDFGLSKILSESDETRQYIPALFAERMRKLEENGDLPDESIRGTQGYIAPEIILTGCYSRAADIFAAGVVMYVLLSGCPPFTVRSTRQTFINCARALLRLEGKEWDHISPEAIDLVRRMLAADPLQRITAKAILGHPWITMGGGNEPTTVPGTTTARAEESEETSDAIEHYLQYLALSNNAAGQNTNTGLAVLPENPVPSNLSDAPPVPPSPQQSSNASAPSTGRVSNRRAHMNMAVSNLAQHVQSLRSDRMAATVTNFLSAGGRAAGFSHLVDRYLKPLVPSNHRDAVEGSSLNYDQMIMMVDKEIRSALTQVIFEHFGDSGGHYLTIDQFLAVRKHFGFTPTQGFLNAGDIALVQMIDRDNDGRISLDDLTAALVGVNQRSDRFLHVVFRMYTESTWYFGQNLNYVRLMQNMKDGNGDSSVSSLGIPTNSTATAAATSSTAPVIAPPKFITAKHVSTVFEQLGYDPTNGVKVFDVLCEALQRIKTVGTAHRIPGAIVEEEAADSDDEEEALPTVCSDTDGHIPSPVLDADSQPSRAPGIRSLRRIVSRKHQMDVHDFIRAAHMDNVLVQVFFRQTHGKLIAIIQAAQRRLAEEQHRQLSLPPEQRKEVTIKDIFAQDIEQSLRSADTADSGTTAAKAPIK